MLFNKHLLLFSSNQTEKRIIKSKTGKTLVLNTPLEHRHMGKTYSIQDTRFKMRAEVGLLTRNIKIQGKI